MNSTDRFSHRLQNMRSLRGMSQEDLAKRSGLKASAVSHFETATRKPSFDNLRRLADALEITVDYLMGRTSEPGSALMEGDQLFRDLQNLTAEDRDFARTVIEGLAEKSKERNRKT